MEEFLCDICKNRYSYYVVQTKSGKKIHICAICARNESYKLNGEERIKFLESIKTFMNKNNELLKNLQEIGPRHSHSKPAAPSKDLFVLQFGVDLTEKAKRNKLDPVIGREKEMDNVLRILKRRIKNNPILIGEPGIGKTAIVEGIAAKIAKGDVPEDLKNKKIISISVSRLVSGTKFRGEFEARVHKIISEIENRKDIILFIDEFHTIIGSGSDGPMDGAQILKPALSRGDIQVIAATTFDEYRYIEKDKALERRFQKVIIHEPTIEETIHILQGIKRNYEEFHDVIIPDEIIREAVLLTEKYLPQRLFPDKAIDLIDEASARRSILVHSFQNAVVEQARIYHSLNDEKEKILLENNFELAKKIIEKEQDIFKNITVAVKNRRKEQIVQPDDLTFIIHQWTGIHIDDINKNNIEKLRSLEKKLKKRVVGQDKAVETLAKAVKRNQLGLKKENRPIGVFLLLGPSGVGKTELSKALAESLLGDEKKLIRFDMSEYKEAHSISKLIGSPPGYVGYEDEGKLTKAIRKNPYSIILFDEIEKAHPEITDLFLQLFDEGIITDSKGRTIDAKNCIFLMTSNIGSELYASKRTSIGYQSHSSNAEKDLETKIKERLKEMYRPEFLNRIDEILIFNYLTEKDFLEIAKKSTQELSEQLEKKGIELKITPSALKRLAEKGYHFQSGARLVKREIDRLKDIIADKIIENHKIKQITIGVVNGEIAVK